MPGLTLLHCPAGGACPSVARPSKASAHLLLFGPSILPSRPPSWPGPCRRAAKGSKGSSGRARPRMPMAMPAVHVRARRATGWPSAGTCKTQVPLAHPHPPRTALEELRPQARSAPPAGPLEAQVGEGGHLLVPWCPPPPRPPSRCFSRPRGHRGGAAGRLKLSALGREARACSYADASPHPAGPAATSGALSRGCDGRVGAIGRYAPARSAR
jgi:hypothetical protein